MNTSNKLKELDYVSLWKEFKFEDIFDIEKGARLTKENMEEGNINFLGAIDNNNGVREKKATA